jgi:glycine cleavage system aminomethyltransferase T
MPSALSSNWDVEVSEPDVAPLQVQGPLSLEVMKQLCGAPLAQMKNYKCVITEVAGQPAVVSRTRWSGGFGYEVFPLSSDRAMELWNAILRGGEPYALKVTGPIVHRAVERGVTDTGYYMNSGMNAHQEVACNFVDLDTHADFVGKEALKRIKACGVKRHSVGLFTEGELPRLKWFWDLKARNNSSGEARWAVHSFDLDRSIGIAIVDVAIKFGNVVEVTHPWKCAQAEVTALPFTGRAK